MADYTTTVGSAKTIRGRATSDGNALTPDDLTGWHDAALVLRHQQSGRVYTFAASLDLATGIFETELSATALTRPGTYELYFSAENADNEPHFFPEGRKKTLEVYPSFS